MSRAAESNRAHVEIMTKELTAAVGGLDLIKLTPTKSIPSEALKSKAIENGLVKIADRVALDVRLKSVYSSFHVYKDLRQVKMPAVAAHKAEDIAEDMGSYGNCLFLAYESAGAYKKALCDEKDKDLLPYVDRIEIATDAHQQKAESSRDYHCIMILRLYDRCIIIDPIASPYAIVVPLGATSRPKSFSNYRFCRIGIGSARLLVHYGGDHYELPHPESEDEFAYSDPFILLRGGLGQGVAQLAWPSETKYAVVPQLDVCCGWIQSWTTYHRARPTLPCDIVAGDTVWMLDHSLWTSRTGSCTSLACPTTIGWHDLRTPTSPAVYVLVTNSPPMRTVSMQSGALIWKLMSWGTNFSRKPPRRWSSWMSFARTLAWTRARYRSSQSSC